MSEHRYFSIILKPVEDGWIQLLHADGYIFMEYNGANIKKTDFKNFQISSWDDLPGSPFWWSFAPKTIPIGKFYGKKTYLFFGIKYMISELTVYRRFCKKCLFY